MPAVIGGELAATFVVLVDLFWHESACNLSLRAGSYPAAPRLRRNMIHGSHELVWWEIRKATGLLTMSAMQAEFFERNGRLRIEPSTYDEPYRSPSDSPDPPPQDASAE